MGEYWSSYTNYYFTELRFSVLNIILKKEKNGFSSINTDNCHNNILPSCMILIYLFYIDLWFLYWWIFPQLHHLSFLSTQIQFLADYKIVEIQLYLKNMNNYHNIFINLVNYGYSCPIEPLVFLSVINWSRYTSFHFSWLRFSICQVMKY